MRSLFSVFCCAGLVFLVGCGSPQTSEPSQPGAALSVLDFGTTKISEIQKGKTNYTVRLQGKIVAQAPLLGQRAFELQDATGKIWVVTKEKLPVATEVKVTGKVRYQSILLEGRESGTVYLEQQGAVEVVSVGKTS
ncbi:hypothetical protein [Phormidesmis priestleyi]